MAKPRALFGVAAQMLRPILVDHAKTKHCDLRGGGAFKPAREEAADYTRQRAAEVVALEEARNVCEKQTGLAFCAS